MVMLLKLAHRHLPDEDWAKVHLCCLPLMLP